MAFLNKRNNVDDLEVLVIEADKARDIKRKGILRAVTSGQQEQNIKPSDEVSLYVMPEKLLTAMANKDALMQFMERNYEPQELFRDKDYKVLSDILTNDDRVWFLTNLADYYLGFMKTHNIKQAYEFSENVVPAIKHVIKNGNEMAGIYAITFAKSAGIAASNLIPYLAKIIKNKKESEKKREYAFSAICHIANLGKQEDYEYVKGLLKSKGMKIDKNISKANKVINKYKDEPLFQTIAQPYSQK